MRRLPIVVGSLFILIVLVIAVGSWFGSSALINPHHDLVKRNVKVVSIFPSQVVLARTAEFMDSTSAPDTQSWGPSSAPRRPR
jgi:hypothetical protein